MKKIKSILALTLLFLVLGCSSAMAADWTIEVNGQPIDAEVKIIEGRSLIPLRAVGEALGLDVVWDGTERSATLSCKINNLENKVVLFLDTALVDISILGDSVGTAETPNKFFHDERTFELEVPPSNIDGSIYIPVRFICNLFGAPLQVDGTVIKIEDIFTAEQKTSMENLRKNPLQASVEKLFFVHGYGLENNHDVVFSISPYYPNRDLHNIVGWVDTKKMGVDSVKYSEDNSKKIVRYKSAGAAFGEGEIIACLKDNPDAKVTIPYTVVTFEQYKNQVVLEKSEGMKISAPYTLKFSMNSVGGIAIDWRARNLSGKDIKYVTANISLYNRVGDKIADEINGKKKISVRYVGPIANGEMLATNSEKIIAYAGTCSKVKIDTLYVEYADGSKETINYNESTFFQ